jgi:hypothetical protein
MKRRQPFTLQPFTLLHERAGGTENEDRRIGDELSGEYATPALSRRLKPEIGGKKKKCRRGQRKSLKRLDSAKETRHSNLDFPSAGFGIASIRLGFSLRMFWISFTPLAAPAFQSSLMAQSSRGRRPRDASIVAVD